MSVTPYHKRYHSDALAGFMSLSLEERGAYQTLLDLMYDRGGPILDNERLLAGYMGVSLRKWKTLRESLIEKGKIYVTDDGLLSNSRVEKELENYAKTSRKRAENGLKGARKKIENQKKTNKINETDLAEPEHDLGYIRNQKPEYPPTPHGGDDRKEGSGRRNSTAPAKPDGVTEPVWRDFLELRKRKRAPLSETALNGIIREARTAGWPLEDALTEAVTRGWQSFKAEFVRDRAPPARPQQAPSGDREAFNRRHPERVLTEDEAMALMGPTEEFRRWKARQTA